jgi:hypothetical protein
MIKTEIVLQYEGMGKFNMYKLNNKDFTLGNYSDEFIQANFKEFKIIYNKIYSNGCHVCFNYALRLPFLLYVEDTVDYLLEHYKQIKLKNICKGDIIAFSDDCNFLHFAKVFKTGKDITDIVIRAKFGHCGIYEHRLINTPSDFGDRFIIFRNN